MGAKVNIPGNFFSNFEPKQGNGKAMSTSKPQASQHYNIAQPVM